MAVIATRRLIAVSAPGRPFGSMYRTHHSHSMLVWLLLLVLLAALLVLAVGALLVAGRPRRRSEIEERLIRPSPTSPAEQILAERLARGEIDGEEYRRRRDILRQ